MEWRTVSATRYSGTWAWLIFSSPREGKMCEISPKSVPFAPGTNSIGGASRRGLPFNKIDRSCRFPQQRFQTVAFNELSIRTEIAALIQSVLPVSKGHGGTRMSVGGKWRVSVYCMVLLWAVAAGLGQTAG